LQNKRKRLKFTAQAIDDMAAIDAWRIEHHSRATADRVHQAIMKSAVTLEQFPDSAPASPFNSSHRHKIVSRYPYVIVYAVTQEAVEILHIWDQSQNYLKP
jgi:plasmid stabilization system protein ParE